LGGKKNLPLPFFGERSTGKVQGAIRIISDHARNDAVAVFEGKEEEGALVRPWGGGGKTKRKKALSSHRVGESHRVNCDGRMRVVVNAVINRGGGKVVKIKQSASSGGRGEKARCSVFPQSVRGGKNLALISTE